MDITLLWSQASDLLRQQLTPVSYATWIESAIKPVVLENDRLVFAGSSDFFASFVSSKYLNQISQTLSKVALRPIEAIILTPEELKNFEPGKEPVKSIQDKLNPRYTFDTFVVGSGNRFAHAASLAVAEAPALAYNPLFLYGGVGLGKTHLMHAIGHFVINNKPNTKLVYVTSEEFTTEMVTAIQTNKNAAFREKYRNVDVLLIDDIQFIAGRDSTQEEFFHTFNALYNSGKQIIISSDRPPKEIAKLEERLSSRFSSGLLADLQKPDFDTRVAILRQKAMECSLEVDDEVLQMIAEKVDSNIRELEGTLTRLSAYIGLSGNGRTVTPELAKDALKEVFQEHQPRSVTMDDIIEAVCEYYAVTRSEILGKRRNRSIALPRQMAMYLCRQLTSASLPAIGDCLGGRDHSTILHGCNKIEELLDTMPTMQAAKNDIIKRLNVTP